MRKLAESAGYTVAGEMEQIREADPRYQIGRGKVEELAQLVKEANAEKVVFDNPLKPLQAYNLAKATGVEAIDRFQLILEIFAKRATTTEAQMQIQLAKLRYDLTQAKERIRLSMKGEQPGFMGLGSYEVDIYYESVKKEVHATRRKLRKIRGKRVLHRERRAELGFSTISLAGYTQAGKSSLFNALTTEDVPIDSTLFTTLSTTTRLVEFSKKKFLLTDTVGFIDRLPLTLIEAFRSTLEETIYANLILLVVDASEPESIMEKKLVVCFETIDRIGASGIPIITVFNKIDLLSEAELKQKLGDLREKALNAVPISALRGTNFDRLKNEVLRILKNYVRASFSVPMTEHVMPFISWLFKSTDVRKVEYTGDSVNMVFEASPELAEKVRNRVEAFKGRFEKHLE